MRHVESVIRSEAGDRPVTLVAVTKYATVEQMGEAYHSGVRHFGENKVQDALAKMENFPKNTFPDLQWHLIGGLQSNKVKKTVNCFSLIHSVDSASLAQMLSRHNEVAETRQKILLQVNISGDVSRQGVMPEALLAVVEQALALPGIDLRGLMVMAPPEASLTHDELALKACFQSVRAMKETIEARLGIDLPELSMGMSHDFPQALTCGATIIRIGNFLFKT